MIIKCELKVRAAGEKTVTALLFAIAESEDVVSFIVKKEKREYHKTLLSGALILCGAFLLLEHLFSFGGFDIEFWGHEALGLGMIIAAVILKIKRDQIPGLLAAIKNRDWRAILDQAKR